MNVLEHGLRLYVCPECHLTKMDAAQMPVHDRDCGGKFKPVEYVPAERLQGAVSRLEADLGRAADALDVAAAALEESGLPLSAQSARASALRVRGQ